VAAELTEQRIEDARGRLQRSRQEIFSLARAMRGDYTGASDEGDSAFPRSRVMRALAGKQGRMLLEGAALAATVLRPTLLWRYSKLVGLLRPVLLRYVLPRLLR
jgi:hypothetical protein